MVLNFGKGMLFVNDELKYEESLKPRWLQEGSTPITIAGSFFSTLPVTFYTVPAKKKFYLSTLIISANNIEDNATIQVKDNTTVKFSFIFGETDPLIRADTYTFNFDPAIEFLTSVVLINDEDNFSDNTLIGWIEDRG